jgi:hypothetical protein
MFQGSRAQPVRRAHNLIAICEPNVETMWDPQHYTTAQASTACYRDIALLFAFPNCNFSFIHKQMTRRLSSGIEFIVFWAVTILRLVHRYQITPPPLPSLYRVHISTVDFPSCLKKEGVVPSETLQTIYQATQRYISEHSRRRENPNSHSFWAISQFISKMDHSAVGHQEGTYQNIS